MRMLSEAEVNDLLRPLGLEIGSWNSLNGIGPALADCLVITVSEHS